MWSHLKNYSDAALLFVRAALGLLLLEFHAWPALREAMALWVQHGGPHHAFWGAVWFTIVTIAKTVSCLFLILGFWARPACLILGIAVALVAAAKFHAHGMAGAETEVELLLLLVALFFAGPGRFSFDKA